MVEEVLFHFPLTSNLYPSSGSPCSMTPAKLIEAILLASTSLLSVTPLTNSSFLSFVNLVQWGSSVWGGFSIPAYSDHLTAVVQHQLGSRAFDYGVRLRGSAQLWDHAPLARFNKVDTLRFHPEHSSKVQHARTARIN